MTEILQYISFVVSLLLGLFNLLILVSSPFRKWLLKSKEEKAKELEREEEQRETDKCVLRKGITDIYFRCRDERKMYQYEFELVEQFYLHYKKLGGNSFIDKIWMEMKFWEIVQ